METFTFVMLIIGIVIFLLFCSATSSNKETRDSETWKEERERDLLHEITHEKDSQYKELLEEYNKLQKEHEKYKMLE